MNPDKAKRGHNPSLEPILNKLGYHPSWLEFGFLDVNMLREQGEEYNRSGDKNTEHYRYAAFRALLAKDMTPDNEFLDQYIRLVELDVDQGMAQNALIMLIGWSRLSNTQLDSLSKHPILLSPILQQHVERTRLLRELHSSSVTEQLFDRCVTFGDDVIQRELLERQDLSRQQVQILRDRGANKAIRNIAKQQLDRP